MGRYICKGCGHESDEPGKCPSCGIDLEAEEESEAKEESEEP